MTAAVIVVVENSWWQPLLGVGVGAAIGIASTVLVVHAENKRFNAKETARAREKDAERIRSSLAAMAGFLSMCAYIAVNEQVDLGETPEQRFERLRGLYDQTNARFGNAVGEILIDPQFETIEDIFKDGQAAWNKYLMHRQDASWWYQTENAERAQLVAEIRGYDSEFSLAARQLLKSLIQAAQV